MRWRKDKPDRREWHRHFAWWPVLLDDAKCVVWLESIWRKGHRFTGAGTPVWYFQHRETPDASDLLYDISRHGT